MRSKLSLILLSMLLPQVAVAHGGGSTTDSEIDAHHAELRDRLQEALGAAYDEPVEGLATANLESGAALYNQHCSSCHGANGIGDGPAAASLARQPSDLTDGAQMKFISDAGFLEVIRGGLPDAGMPAYGETLTEDELTDVYAYTLTFRVDSTMNDDAHACTLGHTGRPTTVLLLGLCSLILLSLRTHYSRL